MFLIKIIFQLIASIIALIAGAFIIFIIGAVIYGVATGNWWLASLIFFPIIAKMTTTG